LNAFFTRHPINESDICYLIPSGDSTPPRLFFAVGELTAETIEYIVIMVVTALAGFVPASVIIFGITNPNSLFSKRVIRRVQPPLSPKAKDKRKIMNATGLDETDESEVEQLV